MILFCPDPLGFFLRLGLNRFALDGFAIDSFFVHCLLSVCTLNLIDYRIGYRSGIFRNIIRNRRIGICCRQEVSKGFCRIFVALDILQRGDIPLIGRNTLLGVEILIAMHEPSVKHKLNLLGSGNILCAVVLDNCI